MERYIPVAQTRPLLIVLVSRIQKSGTGDKHSKITEELKVLPLHCKRLDLRMARMAT